MRVRLDATIEAIVMPGAFRSDAEQRVFVARPEERPPAAVVWPRRAFDTVRSLGPTNVAPRVLDGVMERYRAAQADYELAVLLPLDSPHASREPPGDAP